MKKINVAAIQLNSVDDKEKNFSVVKELSKNIKQGEVDLITLPEAFSFYAEEAQDFKAAEEEKNNSAISFLKKLAIEKQACVSGGTISIKIKGSRKVCNRAYFFDSSGNILSYYDKIHLFDVNLKRGANFKESNFVKAGSRVVLTKTPIGNVGFAICYDLRFPELFRDLTRRGAEIIVVPSAFITKTGTHHFEVLLRARAIENQVFIIATNQIGVHSKNRHTYGGSIIIDPWGTVLARAKTNQCNSGKVFQGEVIFAKLDKKVLIECRKSMPCMENARLLKTNF